MNFASALISMQRGHKIKRHHWNGYWMIKDNEIIMYTYNNESINIRDSKDMLYTVSNMACDDWEIADTYGATKEL